MQASKLNNLSVALLEKNSVGGNTLPCVFSHTQALVYHNKWVASFGLTFKDFGGLPIAVEALHICQTPPQSGDCVW